MQGYIKPPPPITVLFLSWSLGHLNPGGRTLRIYKISRLCRDCGGLRCFPPCLCPAPLNHMPCRPQAGRLVSDRPSSFCSPPLTWHGCPRPWRRHAESTQYVEQMVPPLKITMLYHTPQHSRGLRQKGVRVGVGAARCSHQPSVRGQMRMQPPGEHGPRGP